MNILPLAKEHCANYQNGVCTGVDTEQRRFLPEGSACLLSSGKACRYLEDSILPMEKWDWKNPAERQAFQRAANDYRIMHPDFVSAPAQRRCPDCRENALRPRQRLCDGCSKRRRKTSHAMAVRKWRRTKGSDVHQLTKIVP